MKKSIYLDYNATTPVDQRVLEAMLPYFTEKFGNASSKTHSFGWIAEEAVNLARQKAAAFIGAGEEEIIFTSGSTEAINLSIKGVAEAYTAKGKHIVTVSTEHKAVLDTCAALERKGYEITYLPVDREGLVDTSLLKKSVRDDTILVCVMYANNETGVIQPIREIASIVHEKGSFLMSDATQAAGKIQLDVNTDGIDLLCLSAHKIYGPKGTGALYVRRKNPRVNIIPQLEGGGHERGLRSGTLNVPGIVGLGKACELVKIELWEDASRMSKLRTYLEQHLQDLGNVFVNGSIKNRLSNTSNLSIQGIKASELILKAKNIAMAVGSACTSAKSEPSHVLKAMGLSEEMSYASIRLSVGKNTTSEDIELAITELKKGIEGLRMKI